ncbi:hypothetical protein [Nonomuraea sp. LPB2021202275-12-8]
MHQVPVQPDGEALPSMVAATWKVPPATVMKPSRRTLRCASTGWPTGTT